MLSADSSVRGFNIVDQPQVTDAVLTSLAKIKSLQSASFSRCGVTKVGAEALRKARPDVKVSVYHN